MLTKETGTGVSRNILNNKGNSMGEKIENNDISFLI